MLGVLVFLLFFLCSRLYDCLLIVCSVAFLYVFACMCCDLGCCFCVLVLFFVVLNVCFLLVVFVLAFVFV